MADLWPMARAALLHPGVFSLSHSPSPFCPPPLPPLPRWELLFKKKKKPPPRVDSEATAGEIHGWHCPVGKGLLPADQSEIESVTHFSQALYAAQSGNVKPSPAPWYQACGSHTPVSQSQGRGHIRKGKERVHEGVCGQLEPRASNLRAASASIVTGGGGEKSIGVRETQESMPRSPTTVTDAPSQPHGRGTGPLPSSVSAGVSLAQPSLCLPELEQPHHSPCLVDDLKPWPSCHQSLLPIYLSSAEMSIQD